MQRPAQLVIAEGAHFASHALDLFEAVCETWEETGRAHPDRSLLVFLDEPDAVRPLVGRTRAYAVEQTTVGAASQEIDADRSNFEVFIFQLKQGGQALGWDLSGCHILWFG